jgi:hypothetical protein
MMKNSFHQPLLCALYSIESKVVDMNVHGRFDVLEFCGTPYFRLKTISGYAKWFD